MRLWGNVIGIGEIRGRRILSGMRFATTGEIIGKCEGAPPERVAGESSVCISSDEPIWVVIIIIMNKCPILKWAQRFWADPLLALKIMVLSNQ